ncbi:hypothetical protein ABZ438_07905 [Streptomyces sp. NPDC005786]|uniref:hypothetical protein n=1 Tax=Streptomyces sp. NPDC005786 TaxID=3154891 RepID=UPI0033D4C36C
MGVRLIVEVLDHWQDAGLTAGERDDLLVLAENANDGSRLTWGPVHEPYILRRANKSAAGWKNSIGKLIKKQVLLHHTQGHVGQAAVYRLAQLCPEAPHDGWKGHCTRPERVTSEVTLSKGDQKEGHLSDDPQGHSSGDPLGPKGHLTGVERVISQVTPTPPVSSLKIPSKTSSSPAAPSSAAVAAPADGGGGGVSPSEQNWQAEPLVAALDFRGRPPGVKQRRQLLALVAAALDAGWVEQDLKAYLDLGGAAVNSAAAVYAHRLDPGELPDPATFREAASRPLEGTDATVDGWMALSRQLGGHKPHTDTWRQLDEDARSGVRPAGWERVPHCGGPKCDEVTRTYEVLDGQGLPSLRMCGACHPAMRF